MPVYPSYDFIDVLAHEGVSRPRRRRVAARMNIPVVALIGRPNVGKSALFNRHRRRATAAIVSEEAGTTRDRHFARAEWDGHAFWLVDTGGITDDPQLPMDLEIRRQVTQAIDEADLLLLVVDAKAGLHPSDARVVELLRHVAKAVAARRQQGRRSALHRLLRVLQARRRRSDSGVGDQRQELRRSARRDRVAHSRAQPIEDGDGAARRRDRPAERRQVVVREPAARRGAARRLGGGGHDARCDRHADARTTGGRSSSSTRPGCAASRRSTTASSSTRRCARAARSSAPTSACSWSTRRWEIQNQDLKIAHAGLGSRARADRRREQVGPQGRRTTRPRRSSRRRRREGAVPQVRAVPVHVGADGPARDARCSRSLLEVEAERDEAHHDVAR